MIQLHWPPPSLRSRAPRYFSGRDPRAEKLVNERAGLKHPSCRAVSLSPGSLLDSLRRCGGCATVKCQTCSAEVAWEGQRLKKRLCSKTRDSDEHRVFAHHRFVMRCLPHKPSVTESNSLPMQCDISPIEIVSGRVVDSALGRLCGLSLVTRWLVIF